MSQGEMRSLNSRKLLYPYNPGATFLKWNRAVNNSTTYPRPPGGSGKKPLTQHYAQHHDISKNGCESTAAESADSDLGLALLHILRLIRLYYQPVTFLCERCRLHRRTPAQSEKEEGAGFKKLALEQHLLWL